MKKLISLVLVLMLVTALCGGAMAETIVMIGQQLGNVVFLDAEKGMNDRFARILADSIVRVEPINNLIVVNTLTASANAAGEAIDSMKWSEVMGTIAGDNTLLIITRSNEAAEALMTKFSNLLNG